MRDEDVIIVEMRYRRRIWKVPIALDVDSKDGWTDIHELVPHILMPYYMGKICRRKHSHYQGLSMRRWSDDWCVECQSDRCPELVAEVHWQMFYEQIISNEIAESLDE